MAKTIRELKRVIAQHVEEKQGCKATELCASLEIYGHWNDANDIALPEIIPSLPAIIEQMVKDEELVEIEYTLPSMSYRIKSWLLPAGTEVKVNNGK